VDGKKVRVGAKGSFTLSPSLRDHLHELDMHVLSDALSLIQVNPWRET
jgi:hypothetical protein